MKELLLNVRPVTEGVMSVLEERGLLRRFSPDQRALRAPEGEVVVDRVYTTDPRFGAHMLICVGFNRSAVSLAVHSDKEDFLLVNEGREQKPLILVISLVPDQELRRLVSTGRLTASDIWAIELKFNDPRLSFFTMNGFTPHCEWTVPGPGPAAVFYVTEPAGLDMQPVDLGDYTIRVLYPPPEGTSSGGALGVPPGQKIAMRSKL